MESIKNNLKQAVIMLLDCLIIGGGDIRPVSILL